MEWDCQGRAQCIEMGKLRIPIYANGITQKFVLITNHDSGVDKKVIVNVSRIIKISILYQFK